MGKWEEVKLKDVIKVINGRAYKKAELLNKGKYRVLRVGNLFTNNNWYHSDLELDKDKYCDNGDLIYAWSASFGPRIWKEEKVIYHYHIWKMICNEKVLDKNYAFQFLEWDKNLMQKEHSRGVGMFHLTKTAIENRKFPLPPLPEQQRIVAKLDALFEKIDKAIALLEENIQHTQALMGSVLDEELSGFNYDTSIWKIHKWKDVLTVNNGKNQKQVENSNGKFPIYGSGGIMNYADDFLCDKDSVIIGRKGTINKPIYVETKFWNVDTAFGLTPKKNLLPRYLYFFCLHFNFFSLNKSTTLPSLAKRDLLEIEINLPPLDIQKIVLDKLEGLNNFKEGVIKLQSQKLTNLKALKSSLLDKAFKGEL